MPQPRRPEGPEGRVPQAPEAATGNFDVKLPAGGTLTLNSADEVVMWRESSEKYIKDFKLSKANDLMQLGALLSQALMLYRAQKDLADPKKAAVAQATISKAADDIRKGEKALGIDKATRERGGQHTLSDYLTRLKRAAYEKGVHISERVKAYEDVCMGARWRIRLYRNGDTEDKSYHGVATPEAIITWLETELAKLEELDKTWAKERGAIFVGKL